MIAANAFDLLAIDDAFLAATGTHAKSSLHGTPS